MESAASPSFAIPTSRLTGSPDFALLGEVDPSGPFVAQALLLGARIDTRALTHDPAAHAAMQGFGLTFVFHFGVAVSFGPAPHANGALEAALKGHVLEPADLRETESTRINILSRGDDRVEPDGEIRLVDASHERLLLVATALARSVLLSRDEILVTEAFARSAPLVADLQTNGRARLGIRAVMRLVGTVLTAQHRVMGTAQAQERPDLLWEHPELDRLYSRLEAEYELRERAEILENKLETLGDLAATLMNIVQDKRAYRLEAAIVALIAFEIALTLFTMAHG